MLATDGRVNRPATLYGPWDYESRTQQFPYDDTPSYDVIAGWLDGHGLVEDWGCGVGWAKRYFEQSEYVGLDGAWSRWCDLQVDLRTYRSTVPCVMMRHVLEHNADWRIIAANFAASWIERAALALFIPPQPEELDVGGPDWPVPDLALAGPELMAILDVGDDVDFEYVDLRYPPEESIQWGWEGVVLMERA